jgi:transposase
MQMFLHSQRNWLRVERLPGYSPNLNPVEMVWGNVKGQELANLCVDEISEVGAAACSGLRRVQRSRNLPISFLKHTGLSF